MNGKEISELESGTPSDESKLIIIDPNGTPKQAELGTIKELIGVTRTEWETKNTEIEGEITTESGTRSSADVTLQGNIDTLKNSIIGENATVQVKSAETADKATADEDGNDIKDTYAPLASAALTGSPTVNGNAIVGSGTLEENKPVIFDGTKLVSSDTVLPVVDNLESESASSALSANQGRVLDGKISTNASAISTLEANMFGNGTATIYNAADTDAGQSAGAVVVTLTNYPSVTTLQEGARFRVVMDNDATFESDDDNKYMMAVNGGTAYPVTIGNVEAGIGWAQSGKSYEFVFTGSSYDCLSMAYNADFTTNEVNTGKKWTDGKWIYKRCFKIIENSTVSSDWTKTVYSNAYVTFTYNQTLSIDTIISQSAMIINSSSNEIITSWVNGTSGNDYNYGIKLVKPKTWTIVNGSSGTFVGTDLTLTIEYTKA